MSFNPNFTINIKIANALMRIESIKEKVKDLPITPALLKTLRETAKLQSTHYSTQIEGNRLTQKEVKQVIKDKEHFAGRVRDEKEVKGYYLAFEWLEKNLNNSLNENLIKKIHSLVLGEGRTKTKPTTYRDGQNVISDSSNGAIVYMPPEAKDVSALMLELVEWLNDESTEDFPYPIKAAIAHYQFATIHPYYDGNERTARLLTTFILHQGGYGLKGIYSLEEYYANNLAKYYEAISIGDHHNYYEGRAESDITKWVEYFILGMVEAFESVARNAEKLATEKIEDKSDYLRKLNPKQRKVLTLFEDKNEITSKDIEGLFGFSPRSARALCGKFVEDNFLEIANHSNKTRTYMLKK